MCFEDHHNELKIICEDKETIQFIRETPWFFGLRDNEHKLIYKPPL